MNTVRIVVFLLFHVVKVFSWSKLYSFCRALFLYSLAESYGEGSGTGSL